MFGRDGKSRGFGFVLFKDEGNNKKLLAMSEHSLDGRSLDVKLRDNPNKPEPTSRGNFAARRPPDAPKIKKVFIGRLSDEVTSEDLREHFEQYGSIVDIFMPVVRQLAALHPEPDREMFQYALFLSVVCIHHTTCSS